ncbi:hypothetical protein [Candidatus Nitronereus thalassa]|uniref:Mechanosensitive ion channel MscS C-terminal domain-containing protein n=1 Tax=Candidatus Nitronereus thalassa TaxID=3020898 RepID=A0ABU3KCL8_9BACT|nr:hypothetical protein [Candidatus Nitronereus thalassa]MDT7044131.1 hypothetical protein [Candidatus Nitronereus thalassa]
MSTFREIIKANPRVQSNPDPVIGISMLDNSSINIAVKPWVSIPEYVPAQAELYQAIVERFRQKNVETPCPLQEIRMLNAV